MDAGTFLNESWAALPPGAQIALEEQWAGLAAGGLPCGSAIVSADGKVIASGRNHAYDLAGPVESRLRYPLQHNRLAHAELKALACVPTETNHAPLTLWSTQHPCAMCAAAIAFAGIGEVRFVADDPSDDSAADDIVASRQGVTYGAMDDPLWWTISNVLFLYNSAVNEGAQAKNLEKNRDRHPHLVEFTLDLSRGDLLGHAARKGLSLPAALTVHESSLLALTRHAPYPTSGESAGK